MEHSLWLGLMKTRIENLHDLLRNDGSLWITIDDDECHYLKVLCDEIFGRQNFVANIIWQKKYTQSNDARWFSDNHDHILVYAKNKDVWRPYLLPRTEEQNARYKNPDNDPRGVWMTQPLHAKSGSAANIYTFKFRNGVKWTPPSGTFPRYSIETLKKADEDNMIWFGANGNAVPRLKKYLNEMSEGVVPRTIWLYDEVGSNDEARREMKALGQEDIFATPKPERLLNKIIDHSTKEGDWILDSFAGSGTTGAVAHKKNRKWIMVEIGDHAETHIIPRLNKVISGEDDGGVSKLVGWKRGGGFKYFELGDSLFVKDDDLKLTVINPKMYNGKLIRAILKVEGFKPVNPDNGLHGISGTTAAHVTEQYVTQEYINVLLNEIGDQAEYLVIYAKTFSAKIKLPENVEIKRIPDILLKKFSI
jgi:adenine-specific DNA-methyltransferase